MSWMNRFFFEETNSSVINNQSLHLMFTIAAKQRTSIWLHCHYFVCWWPTHFGKGWIQYDDSQRQAKPSRQNYGIRTNKEISWNWRWNKVNLLLSCMWPDTLFQFLNVLDMKTQTPLPWSLVWSWMYFQVILMMIAMKRNTGQSQGKLLFAPTTVRYDLAFYVLLLLQLL